MSECLISKCRMSDLKQFSLRISIYTRLSFLFVKWVIIPVMRIKSNEIICAKQTCA